ncbi:MAG: sprT domain-containing protein [Crocinitomicaceae bacterium]|nr:sprT domain-containing protein [Crocinitomicaceae bacterium]
MTSREIKKQKTTASLTAFLPTGFEEMVADLLFSTPVKFKIVPPRSTKLGDFRASFNGDKHQITVNGDLNKYSFLITTLHEFAHLQTFNEYGSTVKPHGEEWKRTFRKLLVPAIDTGLLPVDIQNALVNSLTNTKASSCSDIQLSRVLKRYDEQDTGMVLLESLPKNSTFALQGKQFLKGDLRRRRYVCEDMSNSKKYLVHALSEVIPLKNE